SDATRARGSELAPGALPGLLVVAEAQELRPVPEAVRLHLVVAHLDDELGTDRRFLELAAAPAVRLREAPLGGVLEQRQHASRDLVVPRRGDRGGADVVNVAVLVIEAEQEGRDAVRSRLPANAHNHAVGALLWLHLDDSLARPREVGE